MSEQDYKELNKYLNIICKNLNERSPFFYENIYFFGHLSELYLNMINNYDLNITHKENNMTFDEILSIARQIIEKINPNYLESFDNLVPSGAISFNYNSGNLLSDDRRGSWCTRYNDMIMIDIDRVFSYKDIVTIVHEFMHYTNSKGILTYNRNCLTEFVSIYFERFAQKYLIENYGVSCEDLGLDMRLKDLKMISHEIIDSEIPVLAFSKLGDLNSDTCKYLEMLRLKIPENVFNNLSLNLLKTLKNIEKDYNHEVFIDDKNNENIMSNYYIDRLGLSNGYEYQLGYYLSFYLDPIKDKEKVLKINENFNDSNYMDLSPFDYLRTFGIDLDKVDLKECTEKIEEELSKNVKKR